jgi:hypothetical protein
MNISINSVPSSLVFLIALTAPVVALFVITISLIARPWELRGLPWWGRVRIARTVLVYDAWLDVYGVRARLRRDLRLELRANLWEAAGQVGYRQAVTAVGSVRTLARAAAREPSGPNWARGAAMGVVAGVVVTILQLLASAFWLQAAEAAGVNRVDGNLTPFPGMRAVWSTQSGGIGVSLDMGPSALVVGLAVFILAARPWRLVRRNGP